MAQPKRRLSKMKKNQRVRSHKRSYPSANECTACGAPTLPHRVCPSCGTYKGKQVLTVSVEE